jgi:glutaminyl-peptide cyclotransferase
LEKKVNPLSQSQLFRRVGGAFKLVPLLGLLFSPLPTFAGEGAPLLPYSVIATYPHDKSRFTQGLEVFGDSLLESTGGYGTSAIYINGLRDGAAIRKQSLPDSIFGEGLTYLLGELFVLSWREQRVTVFDSRLREQRRLQFAGEGWGLTHAPGPDGRMELVMSDGSSSLKFLDPRSFREIRSLRVRDRARPVDRLNELEFACGRIYANIWLSTRVAVIDPATGSILAWLDLGALEQQAFPSGQSDRDRDDVLNGIAYDPGSGHLFVTGKRWPTMFEIAINEQGSASVPNPARNSGGAICPKT